MQEDPRRTGLKIDDRAWIAYMDQDIRAYYNGLRRMRWGGSIALQVKMEIEAMLKLGWHRDRDAVY